MRPGGGSLVRWAVYPALVYSLVFFAMPFLVMVAVSFWQRLRGRLEATWTLANYEKLVSKDYLLEALVNSVEVTVLTTAVSVLIAYPLAYVLAYRVSARWQKILLVGAIIPFWTAYVVRAYAWLIVLSENGIVNAGLLSLGIIDLPLDLAYTRGATVLGFVHFFTMLLTLTIFASLIQIPEHYRMAASDLGASPIRVFLVITLPLSLPGVAVGAFLTFVITIGDYITPQILGGNTEVLIPQAIMLQIARAANFPMASVMSVSLMLVILAVYLASARYLRMDRI
ncbi:MAG: ABC transporter permease [bacterium]|nr:ABC transporter permease [bacterium]MDE0241876.1 ABC transporter permease [bacterium]MDE0419145.1 ABC transporter permease [bacterium]